MQNIYIKAHLLGANRFFSPSMLMTRLYIALSILLSVMNALFDPTSLLGSATSVTLAPNFMLWLALGVTCTALIDIFINDILPHKYVLKCAANHRHVVYMGLGLISFSLSVALITTDTGPFTVGKLWLDGVVATVVAFLDIIVRRGYIGSSIHLQPN